MTSGRRILLETVFTNLVPLLGVVVLGWRVLDLIFCYMAETWALQVIFTLRSLLARGGDAGKSRGQKLRVAAKFLSVQLYFSGFCFTFVALVFVGLDAFSMELSDWLELALVFGAFLLKEGLVHGRDYVLSEAYLSSDPKAQTNPPIAAPVFRRWYSTFAMAAGALPASFLGSVGVLMWLLAINTVQGLWRYLDETMVESAAPSDEDESEPLGQ